MCDAILKPKRGHELEGFEAWKWNMVLLQLHLRSYFHANASHSLPIHEWCCLIASSQTVLRITLQNVCVEQRADKKLGLLHE